MNIISILENFKTEEEAIKHLESVRWPDGIVCPYCYSKRISPMAQERRHHCNACKKSFSVTVNTIFHKTRIPLVKWFAAISLMLNAKKGLSAMQLSRDIGVNKNTAWRIMMKIREAMPYDGELLEGIVEVDETYVGGSPRKPNDKKHGKKATRGKRDHMQAVVGAISRDGDVVVESYEKAATIDKALLNSFVRKNIAIGTDTVVITDQHNGYKALRQFISHISINHSQCYSEGNGAHINTIESFWAIVKRGIIGQYHKVSERYLARYLDEFTYRFNHRKVDCDVVFAKTIKRGVFLA